MNPRVAILAAAAILLSAPRAGAQELPTKWNGGIYSYKTSEACYGNTLSGIVDPIGVVFHGSAGTYNRLGDFPNPTGAQPPNHIGKHTGWHYVGGKGSQYYRSDNSCNANPSDHSMGKAVTSVLDYHARFWDQIGTVGTHYRLVGTPHMDEHDHGRCNHDHVPAHMRLPNGGTGSGFDYARQRLYNAFKRPQNPAHEHHYARVEYWTNNHPVIQCASDKRAAYPAHSNGHVAIIRTGKP